MIGRILLRLISDFVQFRLCFPPPLCKNFLLGDVGLSSHALCHKFVVNYKVPDITLLYVGITVHHKYTSLN